MAGRFWEVEAPLVGNCPKIRGGYAEMNQNSRRQDFIGDYRGLRS